jgi:hypothetical protein
MPAGTKHTTIGYTTQTVPGDAPLPVLWYFGVRDLAGAPVGAEQTFTEPITTVTFTDLPPGTFEVWGGQRDVAGAPVGDVIKSPPFAVVADVVISIVGTITITAG